MVHRDTVLYFVLLCVCLDFVPDIAHAITAYQTLREVGLAVAGKSGQGQGLKRAAVLDLVQPQLHKDRKFPCDVNVRSPSTPTSVHRLRPGDIAAIGSLGDSLSAGLGVTATQFVHLMTENRGLSWAAGGQGDWRVAMTLPNLLREFNPDLIGASTGDSLEHHPDSGFNAAISAAMSEDLPYMASRLVKQITTNHQMNITNDWKMITISIGHNDICSDVCYQEDIVATAEQHRRDLVAALRILRDNLPRTFVNVVAIPDLVLLTRFIGKDPICSLTHALECSCLFGPARAAQRPLMPAAVQAWQTVEKEVTFMEEFNNRDDFTAVFQPFPLRSTIPKRNGKTDFTYLSKDCFHFSQKSGARAANAAWNNLLEPVGQKSTKWLPTFKKILCPTPERPFLFTNKNSLQYNTTGSL